jgi:hypothetical protein
MEERQKQESKNKEGKKERKLMEGKETTQAKITQKE